MVDLGVWLEFRGRPLNVKSWWLRGSYINTICSESRSERKGGIYLPWMDALQNCCSQMINFGWLVHQSTGSSWRNLELGPVAGWVLHYTLLHTPNQLKGHCINSVLVHWRNPSKGSLFSITQNTSNRSWGFFLSALLCVKWRWPLIFLEDLKYPICYSNGSLVNPVVTCFLFFLINLLWYPALWMLKKSLFIITSSHASLNGCFKGLSSCLSWLIIATGHHVLHQTF